MFHDKYNRDYFQSNRALDKQSITFVMQSSQTLVRHWSFPLVRESNPAGKRGQPLTVTAGSASRPSGGSESVSHNEPHVR